MDFGLFKNIIDTIGDLFNWGEPFLIPADYNTTAYARNAISKSYRVPMPICLHKKKILKNLLSQELMLRSIPDFN